MAPMRHPEPTGQPNAGDLPNELVEQWPVPDEMLPGIWEGMTVAQRRDWLFVHTYERSGDGWVLREDHRDSETSRQVEQAITTMRGADTVLRPLMAQANEDLRRDNDPLGVKRWLVVALGILFALLGIIALLAADLFGGGDDSATETAPPTVTPVEGRPDPVASPEPSDGSIATPAGPASTAAPATTVVSPGPAETITFSSVPDHATYAKTWSDGEIALRLDPDGRYVFRSDGVDTEGPFRVATEDGVDRLLFVDPDDPSGLTVLAAIPISLDGDELVYGEGDGSRRLAQVDELPDAVASFPAPQRLEVVTEFASGGGNADHATLQWPTSGQSGVSYSYGLTSASGGLDVDVEAGTISGDGVFDFACDVGRCTNLDDVGSATVAFAVVDGERSGGPGRWLYDGVADMSLTWNATFACTTGTCEWVSVVDGTAPYSVELLGSTDRGYVRFGPFEGSDGPDATFELSFRFDAPFDLGS